jgi:hypothetical protein
MTRINHTYERKLQQATAAATEALLKLPPGAPVKLEQIDLMIAPAGVALSVFGMS